MRNKRVLSREPNGCVRYKVAHINFQSFVLFVGFHIDIKEIENWSITAYSEKLFCERSESKDSIGDSSFKRKGKND